MGGVQLLSNKGRLPHGSMDVGVERTRQVRVLANKKVKKTYY